MATNQHITPPPSGDSAKNSAARVAAEKARLAKAPPKPAAKVKTTKQVPAAGVNDQQRYEMIAEAAYFRAADRDFAPGHEVDDWVAAEKEIDLILK
jgi:hypothetical protein